MLNTSLPRIPSLPVTSLLHMCESFALCYLARYSSAVIPARVAQSFQRAWAMTHLARVPGSGAGRPTFVLAIWQDDSLTRITVAIEGMRTAQQLHASWVGYNTLVVSDGRRVYHAYKTFGDEIWALLLANTTFTNAINQPRVQLCFTGFSLGAAIAEYMADLHNGAGPAVSLVQLSKWASPRVGNAAWVDRSHLPADRQNFYVTNDPIWRFPRQTTHQMNLREAPWTQGYTNFARNSPEKTLNLVDGSVHRGAYEDSLYQQLRYVRWMTETFNSLNPWYYHHANSYRLMLFNASHPSSAQAEAEAFWRFQFLEYDDDNSWHANYSRELATWDTMTELADPPPPDVTYPVFPEWQAHQVDFAARGHTQPLPVVTESQSSLRTPLPTGAWRPRRSRDF